MTKQMTPPSDGNHGTISFSGRTYQSTGAAISVPDFDAPVLEANRWTVAGSGSGGPPANTGLPSVSGAATIGQTLVASQGSWSGSPTEYEYTWTRDGAPIPGAKGRSYATVAADSGHQIAVSVKAKTASAIAPSSATAAVSGVPTLTVPAGALGLYSVIKTTGWAGNCLQVRRSSDNTTLDIGFSGNVVDFAAADAFAAGSNLFVTTFYDQSGNGKDLTQAATASQPVFVRASHWHGMRPITHDALSGATIKHLRNATMTANAQSCTWYAVQSPRNSYTFQGNGIAINAALSNLLGAFYNQDGAVRIKFPGSASALTTVYLPSNMCSVAMAAGTGGTSLADLDGVQIAGPDAVADTLSIFAMANGATNQNFYGDLFFEALYPATHTPAQLAANRAAFLNAFGALSATKRVVYSGCSHESANGATNAMTPHWVAGFGRSAADDGFFGLGGLDDWECISIALSARTLATENANKAQWLTQCFDAAKTANVFLNGSSATNDINAATYADVPTAQAAMTTLYNNTLLPYNAALIAQGYKIVVPTIFPRQLFGTAGTTPFREDARLFWNTLVRNGAGANGYIVSDRAATPPFDNIATASNTTYIIDGTHPTDAGYAILAVTDRAAILAAGG